MTTHTIHTIATQDDGTPAPETLYEGPDPAKAIRQERAALEQLAEPTGRIVRVERWEELEGKMRLVALNGVPFANPPAEVYFSGT